jgi:hypothetical protein
MSKDDTRLTAARFEALQEAKTIVKHNVDTFGASPIFGFTKWKFFVGVAKTYVSVWILSSGPHDYWKWHACQFWVLFPVHAYRWWKMKQMMYFVELCWVTNAGICTILPAVHFYARQFPPQFLDQAYRAMFALACGPLAIAVPLFGNAMVPHSIDHTMSLLIHLTPCVTSFALKWSPSTLQPSQEPVGFSEFIRPALACLTSYSICHASFFLTFGLRQIDKGQRCSPGDMLKPRRDNAFVKMLGRLGSGGSDVVRYLKYEGVMYILTAFAASLTYGLYRLNSKSAHMALVVGVFASSIWNGATWYEYNLKRLTGGLDNLIDEAASRKDKENVTNS